MNKLSNLSDTALGLASDVGDNLKHLVPAASRWLETGLKLGMLKNGARVAGTFARRNPAILAATVVGGGLLWYAARRRAQRAEEGNSSGRGNKRALEGTSRRVNVRQAGDNESATPKRRATGARKRAASPRSGRARSEARSTTH